MQMTAGIRRIALTTHVTSSVGWLGAVASFLALAIAGVMSNDSQLVRAAYLAMHLTTWFVIVPLSIASLVTGLIDAAGTPWGLFRHYWVVTKLLLTVLATVILLVHTQPIDHVAAVAARMDLLSGDLRQVRLQLVGDAAAALFVLFVTTALSIYKPWGMTPYGIRKLSEATDGLRSTAVRRSRPAGRYVVTGIIGFVLLILVLHLFGVGMHGH
jgi:hypothetical protein